MKRGWWGGDGGRGRREGGDGSALVGWGKGGVFGSGFGPWLSVATLSRP